MGFDIMVIFSTIIPFVYISGANIPEKKCQLCKLKHLAIDDGIAPPARTVLIANKI
ncbi:MAG TPA: hypothetical protein VJ250_06410 [Nitrososphaeraceae archaeon]|nr:hypothetical protein [Nitrososphaeraceae archaeon]